VIEGFARWGFPTNPLMQRCETVDALLAYYTRIASQRGARLTKPRRC
jgi:DNA ligase (NAD+)